MELIENWKFIWNHSIDGKLIFPDSVFFVDRPRYYHRGWRWRHSRRVKILILKTRLLVLMMTFILFITWIKVILHVFNFNQSTSENPLAAGTEFSFVIVDLHEAVIYRQWPPNVGPDAFAAKMKLVTFGFHSILLGSRGYRFTQYRLPCIHRCAHTPGTATRDVFGTETV